MAYDVEAQRALNWKHVTNPQPGDYWEDHLCPALQVITMISDVVFFFDQTVQVDDHHWQWDKTKPSSLSLADFATRLRYKSEHMDGKTWADVHPRMRMAC